MKKDWKLLSEILNGKKHLWQGHLATCKGNTVYLEMLILFSLAGRDRGCLQQ